MNFDDIDIISDETLQTQMFNLDAMAGLDDYGDEMREVEDVLSEIIVSPRAPMRAHTTWPQALVLDIALGLDPLDEILDRFNMSHAQWEILSDNRAFRIDLARTTKEVSESGLSFKRKAATQAEMYLADMDTIMQAKDTTPSLKHEIFKSMVKFGELEPKPARNDDGGVNGLQGFNIQINF